MAKNIQPGELLRAHNSGKDVGRLMKRMKRKSSAPIKLSGAFHGKSNALGHGGRAAQLKARGVSGGVIGNLARAAHAAPGQKNFHGKRSKKKSSSSSHGHAHKAVHVHMKKKRKASSPSAGELGMVMKRSVRKGAAAVHHHIHIHGKGTAHIHVGGHGARGLHEEKRDKHYKRKGAEHLEPSFGGKADDLHEEKRDKTACKTCGKTSHATHEHGKRSKKA